MEEPLRKIWMKPLDKLPVYKDLPRLAGRIIVEGKTNDVKKRISKQCSVLRLSQDVSDQLNEEKDKIEEIPSEHQPEAQKTWRQICKAVVGVAQLVESEERAREITEGLTHFGKNNLDWENEVAGLFERLIGIDSKTARVLKMVNQNILFVGCYELKTKVTMNVFTKDVRGPEGWKILISGTKDTISVSHFKREESLATVPPTEKFWFEWRLHAIFDKEMEDLQAASLKVTNLGFGDETTPAKQEEIKRMLHYGNIIVS